MVLVEELDYVEDVYDLTVEETHCFFADDILVHNCGEILLGDKAFCNLVTIALGRFNGRFEELERAYWLFARANYRQTCVDLNDGILQRSWHELNDFLRLCGTGASGIGQWEFSKDAKKIRQLKKWAIDSANSMADELNTPRPKAVTTVKPDGCLNPETKIKTDIGIISLKEIFSENGFDADKMDLGFVESTKKIHVYDMNNQLQEITHLFNNGWVDTVEVELDDGSILQCTGNHKFLLKSGEWVQAKDLEDGSELMSY